MTVFKVETYVVKPEKQQEFKTLVKKWVAMKEKKPQKFKELKSWKMFAQMIGGNFGGFIEMSEFENLADFEKFTNRMERDREVITNILSGFMNCIIPATYSINIWNSYM